MMRSSMRRLASSERLSTGIPNNRQFRFGSTKIKRLNIPNELWGAASLLLSLYTTSNRRNFQGITASISSISDILSKSPSYPPSNIIDALDYTPRLSIREETICFILSTALCTALFYLTMPTSCFSAPYASCMTLLCAFLFASARYILLERHYSKILMSEHELAHEVANKSSHFLSFRDAHIHYTLAKDTLLSKNNNTIYLHCLHGFGASTYSWSFIQQKLASALRGVVTAHDLPGFGLSERLESLQYYTLQYNGEVAKAVIDHARMEQDAPIETASTATPMTGNQQSKHWLVGHSMGAAAAAEAVIRHPNSIAGVVLVAPAIVALWTDIPKFAKGDVIATGAALMEELVMAEDPPGEVLLESSRNGLLLDKEAGMIDVDDKTNEKSEENAVQYDWIKKAGRIAAFLIQSFFFEIARAALYLSTPLMIILLRKLIRSRAFWEQGLAAAWSDRNKAQALAKEYVNGYRLCMLVRGWERGILRFICARFSEKSSILHAISSIFEDDGHLTQAERLALACRDHSIPVLIVHGTEDALIPVSNSRRLARIIPNSKLVEFNETGHMPHEENSEDFVSAVQVFVQEQNI